ncbi:MAG: DUF3108 domain-containing protein [Devosia sp.]|uniref:DUF3108 domain-containing protein n=1 Tax=Devosia sp. TaxID=1871048 RepID=UPI0024C946CD|nr:DUF3108 domain-containing protein [Devosia sp.]UYN98431.1 MAG: DUF3108 domain-containing protein [Devosia sp.]
MIRSTLAATALVLSLTQVAMAQVDAKFNYVLTLGGLNVALMEVGLTDDGRRYGLDLSANVTGVGSVVASGTAKASVRGSSAGASLVSESFALETRANGEVFTAEVGFSGRAVSTFQVNPPIVDTGDRVPIERSQLSGVGDFISAFVLKGSALDRSLCEKRASIFTGVERFNIEMGFLDTDEATSPRTGYQGPLVACSLRYRPISGHFASSEMTTYLAESSRMVLWYAPLGQTGYYVPYRVIVGTSMGDLSMILVGMRE